MLILGYHCPCVDGAYSLLIAYYGLNEYIKHYGIDITL